jgi:hypothetical protein
MTKRKEKLVTKLKRVYAKMLSAYAKRKLEKAYKLEDKAILLELELREQRLLSEKHDDR